MTFYRRKQSRRVSVRLNLPFLILMCFLLSGCFETIQPLKLDVVFPKVDLDPRLYEPTPPLPLLSSGREVDILTNYSSVLQAHMQCISREAVLQNSLRQLTSQYGTVTEEVLRKIAEHNASLGK